jgi:integrase
MSVETRDSGNYRVVWRDESGKRQSQTFPKGQKAAAEAFDGEMKARKLAGTSSLVVAGRQTLAQYWVGPFADHLTGKAQKTRTVYAHTWAKHIEPRLGPVPLGRLKLERVRRFHADLLRDGVKPGAADKAMAVLSAILGLAEADEVIPANPVPKLRRKRPKARVPRPLAPATVEDLRALLLARQAGPHPQASRAPWVTRDAIVVSLLAYSGIRPHELRALRWWAIQDHILSVPTGTKTEDRPVRLLSPLRQDLAEWRLLCGRPRDDQLVIPGERETDSTEDPRQWSAGGFTQWAGRVLRPAATKLGRPDLTPYHLRHSFASLLAHEGRSAVYIAEQMGHGPDVSVKVYQHVIRELEDAPSLSAEEAIRQAREQGLRKLGT